MICFRISETVCLLRTGCTNHNDPFLHLQFPISRSCRPAPEDKVGSGSAFQRRNIHACGGSPDGIEHFEPAFDQVGEDLCDGSAGMEIDAHFRPLPPAAEILFAGVFLDLPFKSEGLLRRIAGDDVKPFRLTASETVRGFCEPKRLGRVRARSCGFLPCRNCGLLLFFSVRPIRSFVSLYHTFPTYTSPVGNAGTTRPSGI